MEKLEGNMILLGNVMDRLEIGTGLARRTLYNLLQSEKETGKRTAANKIDIDDFDRENNNIVN